MYAINLPPHTFRTKYQDGKEYIFDNLRKQFVRLTPEEYVRQHFTHYLTHYKHYPEALLANEKGINLGNVSRRCDTVVYSRYLEPLAIIEYKAPTVEITQDVFDQIIRYNMVLRVPWLIVSNGMQHFCCHIDYAANAYQFIKDIPAYPDLAIKD